MSAARFLWHVTRAHRPEGCLPEYTTVVFFNTGHPILSKYYLILSISDYLILSDTYRYSMGYPYGVWPEFTHLRRVASWSTIVQPLSVAYLLSDRLLYTSCASEWRLCLRSASCVPSPCSPVATRGRTLRCCVAAAFCGIERFPRRRCTAAAPLVHALSVFTSCDGNMVASTGTRYRYLVLQ